MTTDDDNATTWRDLANQLTPEQIARFDHAEQLCMTGAHLAFPQNDRSKTIADLLDGVLKEARWEAQQNLTDAHTFGHVPRPAGGSQPTTGRTTARERGRADCRC